MLNAELSNFSSKFMAGVLRWGLTNSSLSLVCSGCCTPTLEAKGFLGLVLGSGGTQYSQLQVSAEHHSLWVKTDPSSAALDCGMDSVF